ncbi:MAG: hypothetical protein U9Q99_00105 [Nanoarchaeota archaeon]|nr:hypothetical protein [Nanoarchaeota archaeon]
MNDLVKKIGGGILGFTMMFLPMKNLYGQTSENISKQDSSSISVADPNPWQYSFGTSSMSPHDPDFKDAFGSYFAITANAEKKIEGNLYARVVGNIGFGSYKIKGIQTVRINQKEFGVFGIYNLGNFSIGVGPKIVSTTLGGEYSTMTQFGTVTWKNFDKEKYSGLGLSLIMEYLIKLKGRISLKPMAEYSKVDDANEEADLGSTKFGVVLVF